MIDYLRTLLSRSRTTPSGAQTVLFAKPRQSPRKSSPSRVTSSRSKNMRKSNVAKLSRREIAPLPQRLRHHVSAGLANRIHGWIYDPDRPSETLRVRIMQEQRWGLPPIDVAVIAAT